MIDDVRLAVSGMGAVDAAAFVRGERERLNARRLDLIKGASVVSPNQRDPLNDERIIIQAQAAELSVLLIEIEGASIPESATTTYTIEPA